MDQEQENKTSNDLPRTRLGVMTVLDSPGLSAIDQLWLDSLWEAEMLASPNLSCSPEF